MINLNVKINNVLNQSAVKNGLYYAYSLSIRR